jgi:hypothetical protein
MATGKKAASDAGKVLKDPKATSAEKQPPRATSPRRPKRAASRSS